MTLAAAGPVEFSHAGHNALKIECAHCHAGATRSERAGLPAVAQCMVCHQTVKKESAAVAKLASLPRDARPFTRNHPLADFVVFSHARHSAAKITCTVCHAAAGSAEPAVQTKMKFCVDCHKERRASAACNVCHELSQ